MLLFGLTTNSSLLYYYTCFPFLLAISGTWVETQRVQKKKLERSMEENGTDAVPPSKRLGPERLAKLEAIGFKWSAKKANAGSKDMTISNATSTSPAANAGGNNNDDDCRNSNSRRH